MAWTQPASPVNAGFSVESRIRNIEDALSGGTLSIAPNGTHYWTYPGIVSPVLSAFGNPTQVANPGAPARTNAHYFGLAAATDGAVATTGIATNVAVPVEVGDVFTNLTVYVGATAGATLTQEGAALYQGTNVASPPILGAQATLQVAAAVTASTPFVWTFPTPVTVTAASAPNGYIYASFYFTGTTMPTLLSQALTAAVGYRFSAAANSPIFLASTAGSALTTTSPATLVTPAIFARAPIVLLS